MRLKLFYRIINTYIVILWTVNPWPFPVLGYPFNRMSEYSLARLVEGHFQPPS